MNLTSFYSGLNSQVVVLSGLGSILCVPIFLGPFTVPEYYLVYWSEFMVFGATNLKLLSGDITQWCRHYLGQDHGLFRHHGAYFGPNQMITADATALCVILSLAILLTTSKTPQYTLGLISRNNKQTSSKRGFHWHYPRDDIQFYLECCCGCRILTLSPDLLFR